MKKIAAIGIGILVIIIGWWGPIQAQTIIEITPAEHDFGDLAIGDSSTIIVNIRNINGHNLNIIDVSLRVDSDPDFYISQMDVFPVVLDWDGNDSTEVEITFEPISEGNKTATVVIVSDDLLNPEVLVPLFGEGIEPATEFKLSGVEIVKGFDIGDVRYGTTFMGNVYEGDDKVGYWWTVIQHTDTENIEVCGESNNLLNVKLVVVLNGGTLAGNRLVLGLQEPEVVEDVLWDSVAPVCGFPFFDKPCACPDHPDDIEIWNCELPIPERYGPVATIEHLNLKEKFGTTLNIEEAYLSGWLCHNWSFIPRVAANLTIVLEE